MDTLIRQKIYQFLVHSYLYYQLDESIITDRQYDELCRELRSLLPSVSNTCRIPYWDLAKKNLGGEASGFTIRKYPHEIVSTAIHLLYQHRYINAMNFDTFLVRFGYRLV